MIKLSKVSKKFQTGEYALAEIDLNIDSGEFVFLVGSTGAGKTTIFRLLTREMLPTDGTIIVNDWDIIKLPNSKIPNLRKKIGVVFQDLKILQDRTIFENVMMPLEVVEMGISEAKKRAEEVIAQVGLTNHKDKFPMQLSGGELQRAAIARALVLSPDILLADEPTGNLDMATSWEIVNLLSDINKKGTTILMATHNLDIIKNLSKRVVKLEKGKIVHDDKNHDKIKKEHPQHSPAGGGEGKHKHEI
jgi:cell division transport system ATP-binding protein